MHARPNNRDRWAQFMYINLSPPRIHVLDLDPVFGRCRLHSNPDDWNGADPSIGWHGHTSWTNSGGEFFANFHFAGEEALFQRRISFRHLPFYLRRFNFDVYLGKHEAILADGRVREMVVENWCVIARYLPPPIHAPSRAASIVEV